MNECTTFREYVIAWLDGELSSGASAEARAHFAWCRSCRAFAAPYVEQQSDLASLSENQPELSDAFWTRLDAAVDREMGIVSDREARSDEVAEARERAVLQLSGGTAR